MEIKIRDLELHDYDKEYLQLLSQLSVINVEKISRHAFSDFTMKLHPNHQIKVIEDTSKKIIIATATLIIEQKLIHDMKCVAHVEDVVIHEDYRGLGLGKKIIDHLVQISRNQNCYKTLLDCSQENTLFYEKCGFKKNCECMSIYFI